MNTRDFAVKSEKMQHSNSVLISQTRLVRGYTGMC
jgi:hypothetical protein